MKYLFIILAFKLTGCTTIMKPKHTVVVERKEGTDFENELIEKAETLPVREQDLTQEFIIRNSRDGIRITERWWSSEVDGTRMAYTVNADAAKYYRKHSRALRFGKLSKNGIRMKESSFRYSASEQYHSVFTENDTSFENVYVVTLELHWYQYCGTICSASWSRTKKVIFDEAGNVVEVIEPIETEYGLMMLISNNSNKAAHTTSASARRVA